MNLLLHEVRSMLASAVIWAVVLCALAGLYLVLFAEIARDADTFKRIFAAYPVAIQHALGVTIDSVASLPGFYTMVLTFVTLSGAIQATNAGVSILSKESRDGTADFLYTKPVSRFGLVSAKLGAVLLVLLATDAVYSVVSGLILAGAQASSGVVSDPAIFVLLNLTLLAVQLMMFSMGLAVSLLFRRLQSVLPVSLGLVFGLYLVGALVNTDEAARWLSPFKYFDLHEITAKVAFQSDSLLAALALIAFGVVAAYVVTLRRDLHVR